MGTDIHLQVQVKTEDGGWEYVKRSPFAQFGEPGFSWENDPKERDYCLFALLAGVRNGFGFAGSYRHEPVQPAFRGRGLPDGLTPDDLEHDEDSGFIAGDDWVGDHSFTWATLAEIRDVDFTTEFDAGGIVSRDVFNATKPGECPEDWCSLISGPSVRVCESVKLFERDESYTHCRIRWKYVPLADCPFKRWAFGDVMSSIADEHGGPENVRVLIGFDS